MSTSIKIFSALSIIFSLWIILVTVPELIHAPSMFTIVYLISAVCWSVFGLGILKRLPWARIGLICLAVIYIFDSLEHPSYLIRAIKYQEIGALTKLSLGLIFFISVIVFFTRPKIKQQFIKKTT